MVEVIVSLFARDPEQVVREGRRAAMAGADWIELRLDGWSLDQRLGPVLDALQVPVLVTCRMPRDGGTFRGSLQDRRVLLERALEAGAQGVDLEDWETWSPRGDAVRLLIRSHHDLRGVPADPAGIRDRLLDQGSDGAKVGGRADDLADAAPLMDMLAASDPKAEPTVAFATGRTASPTRLLSVLLGSPFVYASLAEGAETAPGQLPVADLVGVYGVRELGTASVVFGVLGDPALGSLGPWIHNRALRVAGVDGVYLPLETKRPLEVLEMLPRRRVRGISVTAPHKVQLYGACQRVTPEADAVGAINTLTWDTHGAVLGHNTDVAGVVLALERAGVEGGAGRRGVVLGGGGAARAAAVALAQMGFSVTILARSLDKVREFSKAQGFRLGALRRDVLEGLDPSVVVQATPCGSAGHAAADQALLPGWLPPEGCAVLELVYRPRSPPFLDRVAAGPEAVAIPGLSMFLAQAAEQTRLFYGRRIDEEDLGRFLAGATS
ncbi:MAG: type I 3-dehydroquinate dehydratase [Planctomycetota bacterium]